MRALAGFVAAGAMLVLGGCAPPPPAAPAQPQVGVCYDAGPWKVWDQVEVKLYLPMGETDGNGNAEVYVDGAAFQCSTYTAKVTAFYETDPVAADAMCVSAYESAVEFFPDHWVCVYDGS